MKKLVSIILLAVLAIASTPTNAKSAMVALVNSPTGNATFLANFKSFIEARGDSFVRNPSSFSGVDVVFNVRQPVSTDMKNWVLGGGLLITEYTGIKNAGDAGLLSYSDTGGGNAGTGTSVTFTAAGISRGLNIGMTNPYSDGGATEFFRNGIAVGSGVEVLATRPVSGGGTLPAIVGATAGSGYVLGIAYDWGDAFIPNSALTRQLITNAMTPVPEPSSLVLAGAGAALLGLIHVRRQKRGAK